MNKNDLNTVIENAKSIFEEIRKKYNLIREIDERYEKLKEYLVFSSQHGQCEMTSNIQKILEEFPEMIHDSIHKKRACELLQGIRNLKKEIDRASVEKSKSDLKKKMDNDVKSLAQITENLEVMENTFVEIRFNALDYNILDDLRKDPVISLKHTPQTRASIRIVLGTLIDFLQSQERRY